MVSMYTRDAESGVLVFIKESESGVEKKTYESLESESKL